MLGPGWIRLLVVLGLGQVDAGLPVPGLAEVLERAGASEARRELVDCAFEETTTVEELAKDGTVKGSFTRTHAIALEKGELKSRTTVSESSTGEVSSLLTKEPPPPSKADAGKRRTAFHPTRQQEFRFRLAELGAQGLAKVVYWPKEKSPERAMGTAWLDARTGALVKLEATPSELPAHLDRMALHFDFEDTACGVVAKNVTASGEGGFLLFTMRFRSRTTLSKHRVP